MRRADFAKLLKKDFQEIEDVLADGIFAAYLLGFDESNTEVQGKIKNYTNNSYDNYVDSIDSLNFAERETKKGRKKDDKLVEQIGSKKLNLQLRFDVPPTEAIDYFKRKQVVTKKEFNKLDREAKAASFTVQGIYKEDVLTAFQKEISDALESGQTQKFVVDRFKKILDGAGHKMLGDFHLESVTRKTMRTAYFTGLNKLANRGKTSLLTAILENTKQQLIIRNIILWKEKNLDLNLHSKELREKRLDWATETLNLKNKCNSFIELSIEQLRLILERLMQNKNFTY